MRASGLAQQAYSSPRAAHINIYFFPTSKVNIEKTEDEEDGDLLVQEYFNLTGTYNGFERIILYKNDDLYEFDSNMSSFGGSSIHNGDGLEIIEVRALPINSSFSFDA